MAYRQAAASILTLGSGHETDALKRQLVHLADAMAATDAVNLQGLKLPRVSAMLAQIAALHAKLDVIERRIDDYQDSLTVKLELINEGSSTRIDLAKSHQITVAGQNDGNQWGPKNIAFGFFSDDGHDINGLSVLDAKGKHYPLHDWWTQIDRPLSAESVSLTIPAQPGRLLNVQWWYGW